MPDIHQSCKFVFPDSIGQPTIQQISAACDELRRNGPKGTEKGRFIVQDNDTSITIQNLTPDMVDALYAKIETLGFTNVELYVPKAPDVSPGGGRGR